MKLDRKLAPSPYDLLPSVPSFTLASDDVSEGQPMARAHILDQWGVGGENLSPQLSWSGFPPATRSFAVTCYDPDAPTGSGFWHWLASDIPADVTSLPRGAGARGGKGMAAGTVMYRNDYGDASYGGAAPPEGDRAHRYYFAVHALDVDKLGIDAGASPAFVGFNLTFHTLARAVLVPVFGR